MTQKYSNLSWRGDPGLTCKIKYKKRYAFLPTLCYGNKRVWLKNYYKKYEMWYHGRNTLETGDYLHTDFIENVSEEEYIIRKLAENF